MRISPLSRTSRGIKAFTSSIQTAAWAGLHSWNSRTNFSGVAHESSFPFISADTFRLVSDTVIANEMSPEDLTSIAPESLNSLAMVELSFIKNKNGGKPLLDWVAAHCQAAGRSLKLVMHNGDWVPNSEYLESLAGAGAEVYCVNVLDEIQGVTPIPVGLENTIRRKNGVLHDFLFVHDQLRQPWASFPPKTQNIFASFKVSTNPSAREPLRKMLKGSRFNFIDKRLPIKDFRSGILRSRFVLSPPGNGPDCYRTWESIYLGAVPIVVKGSLAQSLHSELPIWAVDDWEEALTASDEELDQKYLELISRAREKAYFPYWLQQISPPAAQ